MKAAKKGFIVDKYLKSAKDNVKSTEKFVNKASKTIKKAASEGVKSAEKAVKKSSRKIVDKAQRVAKEVKV